MATITATQQGVVTANAYGVTVDSSGNLDISGLVDKVMASLDIKAPNFVKAMVATAAQVGATEAAIEGAITTATAALPEEIGGAVGAFGPFAPVAAIVLAVPTLLLALDPASPGTGCCGTAPLSTDEAINLLLEEHKLMVDPAAPYVPSQQDVLALVKYSGQNADAPPCPGDFTWENEWGSYTSEPGAEAFIDAAIRAAYTQATGCWSYMTPPEYPVVLAAAVGAWNRAHQSQRTISGPGGKPVTLGPTTLFRMVNVTKQSTFGGNPVTQTGEPDDGEPLSVALNMAAQNWTREASGNIRSSGFLVKPNALASLSVNEGSAIAAGTVQSVLPKLRLSIAGATATLAKVSAALTPPAPAKSAALAPVRTVVTRPAPMALPVAWYDRQIAALGGATPKEAGIFGAVVTAASWALKAARG